MNDQAASTNQDTARAMAPRRGGKLFRKYVVLFVALVGGALLVHGALELWFSYQENKAALAQIQHEKALAAAARIEQFIDEITRQIGWTTRAQWSRSVLEQRRFEYLQLLRQAPAVTEVSHLDAQGHEELRVSRLAMDVIGSGTDYSSDPKFTEAKARKTWFSPVYFRKESEPYITVALAGTGRDSGVTVAEVNLKFIWDVISRIKVGQAGYAYVVDTRGLLIAHPDIGLVLRKTDFSGLPQVSAALADPAAQTQSALVGTDSGGRQVLTAHAAITPLDWTVFVDMPLTEAFAPLYASMQRSAALIVLGLALAVGAGLLLARRMVVPIQALQAGAARIGAGDLDHRIEIKTGDELETLADQFNSMTAQLEESYTGLERKVEERTQELRESLEYQTATSDVLKVISRSRVDLQPVLDTLVETAARLCDADAGFLFQFLDGAYRVTAQTGFSPEVDSFMRASAVHPGRGTLVGRVALAGTTVHIDDVAGDSEYSWSEARRRIGFRTMLGVPLLRDGEPVGVFSLVRTTPRPFAQKQIELVTVFADQAVIAIENTRLLDALQARTDELGRSVEELTATSDVLRIIARSPKDLQPVLDTLVETATQLCRGERGFLYRLSADGYRMSAAYGFAGDEFEFMRSLLVSPGEGTLVGRTALLCQPVRFSDALNDPTYKWPEAQRRLGYRSTMGVPLLREGEPIGVFAIMRNHVEPFTDRQVELLTTFADQAVIAIENARLLEALQARTDELGRSVEELTATSEILRVIASSPGKLQPVLQAVAENASRLCEADQVTIHRVEQDNLRFVASFGFRKEQVTGDSRFKITRASAAGRAVIEKCNVHVTDIAAERSKYPASPAHRYGDVKTVLAVPLMREGTPIGTIVSLRTEARPFTEKQIELVTSFADQAVIAIENARLLDELQARTNELTRSVEELKALGEVGRAVSSTLDLRTVLETVVARGASLGEAEACSIYRYRQGHRQFKLWHAAGLDPALATTARALDVREDQTLMGRAVQLHEPVQIPDLADMPNMPLRDATLAAGYRSVLIVPLVRAQRVFGALVLNRREPGEFSTSTINLLRTFASQSILAIQNAQLFQEIEDKGRQLEIASQHKSQFLANMSHELRTPLNAILGYTELLLDGLYGKLGEKAQGVLERVQTNGKHLLGLINDVLDLAKIEAGQLTLALSDYAVGAVVQSVVVATESLAKAKGLELRAEVAPAMPLGRGDERRLTQVLLNLVGNAIKFTETGSVTLSAIAREGRFKLAVRDTGPGIAPADQARIFEEFQQVDNSSTRKKGGTGLGLAISKRIVEMHGGTITVESQLGAGATFRIDLPIRVDDAREVA
jgi:signal transduction histidine kinase